MLDASEFLPRSECCRQGQWPAGLQVAYITAHLLVAAAYLVNPVILLWLYRTSHVVNRLFKPWRGFVPLYAAFIFFCGCGHLLEGVASFWWPNYPVFTVWHGITAVVSWVPNVAIPLKVVQLVTEHAGDGQ